MITDKHRQLTNYILSLVGRTNPWNRELANSKSEFYIYNMGFLASYLASLAEQDPWVLKRFEQHCQDRRSELARRSKAPL